ncbi:hypothetical protein VD0004_g8195 [Verticillium dahliae]|nr:hypothetical protein VD0004_g8195 [Verticillium dahliae]PNH74440.1 hypothetical protein VD0001_g3140 [Verticillium dahliae]
MASSDLRDVLNLDAHAGPRPAKKLKTAASRPNLKGLAREVQNLGGDNPIAIVPEVSVFKKRRTAVRKPAARWELRAFQNSSRGDDGAFVLRHWRRKTDGDDDAARPGAAQPAQGDAAAPADPRAQDHKREREQEREREQVLEDSAFAKYNVHVDVPQYSPDQYQSNLVSADWTKDETDYLMGLVREFDLRWPVIWDRYDYAPEAINGEASADGDESKAIIPVPKPRTMEALKARYYEIAAKMMSAQTPVQYMTKEEFALHETMLNFNPQQERVRKDFAVNGLSRTKEEANEEESLLVEIKRILARSSVFNEERRELYNRLDYPHTDQDINAFKSSTGLQTLLQNMMAVDKNKKRKSLMGADGVSPGAPGQQQAGAGAAAAAGAAGAAGAAAAAEASGNRRESIAVSAAGGHRDSIGSVAQTPTTEKGPGAGRKGAQTPHERRKLSEAEKFIYGVSHHDRLQAGPTFRYEKINKLFTNKSGQQQIRIANALNELDIPQRLVMPTAAVTAQFEQLLGAINSLLDARKVTDKIDAEIKIELAKKAQREPKDKDKDKDKDKEEDKEEQAKDAKGENPAKSSAAEAAKGDKAKDDGQKDDDDNDDDDNEPAKADKNADRKEDAATEEPAPAAAASVETNEEKASPAKAARPPSSSGPHKRSASVLSGVSDKSAKRLKK